MGLRRLGDSAWLFKVGLTDPERALALVLRLRLLLKRNPIAEITDIVSSFDSIAVHFDPSDGQHVFNHLTSLHLDQVTGDLPVESFTITVPVVYGGDEGPDLKTLAAAKQLKASEVADLHRETEYTVAAIGFSPGFPYLQGLPPELNQPRQATPRMVPAGSVAIAGNQTGIYPHASQGGWHVIGRTNLTLFDPQRDDPSLLQPGDKVRFVRVDKLDFAQAEPVPTAVPDKPAIQVLDPGAITTIQDPGRPGFQHLGVSPCGAADPVLACIANRLVGNPDEAPVIECTMNGPKLQFDTDARVAWVGWGTEASGRPHEITAGARVDLSGRTTHLRGYIGVAGGIKVPEVLGSHSTDLRAGMGGHHGRALKAGDTLAIGDLESRPISPMCRVAWPHPSGYLIELRFVRGMQAEWFDETTHDLFTRTFFEISPASDRMGVRLQGAKLKLANPREMVSQPVVAGSVQVPPDGNPIILMGDRQTIGGYPQIGHVISADLPLLARAWPGTQIHFREVGLEEARDAWDALKRDLGLLRAGLQTLD